MVYHARNRDVRGGNRISVMNDLSGRFSHLEVGSKTISEEALFKEP
jgi:hypothetical protein